MALPIILLPDNNASCYGYVEEFPVVGWGDPRGVLFETGQAGAVNCPACLAVSSLQATLLSGKV